MALLSAVYDAYVNITGIWLATPGTYTPRMDYGDMPGYEWFSISVSNEGRIYLIEVNSARSHIPERLLGHVAKTRTIPVTRERAEADDQVTLWLGTKPATPTHIVPFAEEEDFDGELEGTVWLLLEGDILTGLRFEGASRLLPPEVMSGLR